MGEMINGNNSLVGKREGKRPRERPRHRWEDNVKRILGKWGWKVWIGFIWPRIGTGGGLI
jgi:hypothetical protein